MAAQEGNADPSAQVVGNAFVDQYYHILHQSPGLVHRFYHDSSLLSRPDAEGVMTTVTTMQVSYSGTKISRSIHFHKLIKYILNFLSCASSHLYFTNPCPSGR